MFVLFSDIGSFAALLQDSLCCILDKVFLDLELLRVKSILNFLSQQSSVFVVLQLYKYLIKSIRQ